MPTKTGYPPPGAGRGYVAGFGQHEPEESLDQQRTRLQQRSARISEVVEEDDLGEHDWPVAYADMVTLLMAFFIILTSISVNQPRPDVGLVPNAMQTVAGPSSPFDGQGRTIVEMGMPAGLRDDVDSRFDDPDAAGGTTDPAPSGEQFTGPDTTAIEPVPPPPAPPPEPAVPKVAPPPPANPLAEQLRDMVKQNDLAGQVEVITGAQSVTVRISDRILFASGKALLEDGGRALVQRLSAILAQTASQGGIISIEGHTDNMPIRTAQYPSNWELSAARAAMVVRELAALGLPAGRLRAIGYADTRPVAANTSREGRSSNRRVELVITTEGTPPSAAAGPAP